MKLSTEGLARAAARHPWRTLGLWAVLLVVAIVAASGIGDVVTEDTQSAVGESSTAAQLIEERLRGPALAEEFIVVESQTATVDEAALTAIVGSLVAELRALDEVESAVSYLDGAPGLLSGDGRVAMIPGTLGGDYDDATVNAEPLIAAVEQADATQGFRVTTMGNGSINGEFKDLVNAVTINETFFFRNVPKFDLLEKELIPEIIALRAKEGKRQVRIWSAACSTGDEPYTIALLVKDRLQPRYPNVRFEIVGTDINTDVLEKARAGIYGDYAVRNVPPPVMRKHFKEDGARYRLNPEVCRMVRFHNINLSERVAMTRMRGIDIVLCANVLIYFDNQAKQRVVSSIYNNLNAGGFLLVGFSETLYGVTQSFQPVRFDKTIAYKKG